MSDLINRQDAPDINVGDMISRQAVIDMVKGWNLNQHIMNEEDALDDVNVLPSAEPETKLIAEVKISKEDIQSAVDEAVEKMKAEPERKNGKWIGKEQFANSPEFYSWQCSVCGCVLEDPTLDKPYPFCSNCGSFNGGEQE